MPRNFCEFFWIFSACTFFSFFVWKVPMNDIALVRTTVPIRKAFDFALPICSRKTAPEDLRGVILAAVGMGSILPPSQEPEYPAELQV